MVRTLRSHGLLMLGLLAVSTTTGYSATFSYIWLFDSGNYIDGSSPSPGLIRGSDGGLYGTTAVGGLDTQCAGGSDQGCGVFYSLRPSSLPGGAWTEEVLWNFGGTPNDAAYPGPLTEGANGVFYGVSGGGNPTFPEGTIFSLSPPITKDGAWTEKVLYLFGGAPDGGLPQYPNTPLAIDSSGILYGITYYGGTSKACAEGCGTVFALAPPVSRGGAWTETILWNFAGGSDGANPVAGPVLDSNGVLYAATYSGGAGYRGNVFALSPPARAGDAWTKAVLHTFPASAEQHPASLILASTGELYGTTILQEGTSQGGTIFSLTPPTGTDTEWRFATVFSFPTEVQAKVSHQPSGPLLLNEGTGVLFGATGGGQGSGTVFKLLPPKPGETSWTKLVLDHTHLFGPAVSLRIGDTTYGTDPLTNSVWSLEF